MCVNGIKIFKNTGVYFIFNQQTAIYAIKKVSIRLAPMLPSENSLYLTDSLKFAILEEIGRN